MRDIDFLPEWYRQNRQRRDSRLTRTWLGMIGLGALFVWFAVGRISLNQAQGRLAHLESQNQMVQAGLGMIDQLAQKEAVLLKKYELAEQLTPTTSCVRVLSKLAKLIPPQVAVKRLELVNKPSQSEGTDRLATLAAKLSGPKSAGASQEQFQKYELHVSLQGLAPSEMDVAVLVGQLSGSQDFSSVALEYCNAASLKAYQGCTFKVNFVIKDEVAPTPSEREWPEP